MGRGLCGTAALGCAEAEAPAPHQKTNSLSVSAQSHVRLMVWLAPLPPRREKDLRK